MSNEKENKLRILFNENPEFRGKFIGYYEPRGGLGISRIDNDWYNCEDYLIPIEELIEALEVTKKNYNDKILDAYEKGKNENLIKCQ